MRGPCGNLRMPKPSRQTRPSDHSCPARLRSPTTRTSRPQFRPSPATEDRWAIIDLVGKGGHVRTVPVPDWVKQFLDEWFTAARITSGKLFCCVCRSGTVWGDGMTEKVVWHVVKMHAKKLDMPKVAPHDLRRSCARFCHAAGGELEQIQFLLGHVSIQTTERYLGCKQRFREAVNDRLGIGPTA